MVFQIYAVLSRAVDKPSSAEEPPSLRGVAVGGMGTGAVGSLMLTPVELVKIRLQAEGKRAAAGPVSLAKSILRKEGLRGMFRGLTITLLRDAPAHGVYFWTYEYVREALHPGCRRSGDESLRTMLVSGGLAGVASWGCCYPLDVVKTRLQADRRGAYLGIVDCFRKSVQRDGYAVLSRGLGTALSRAFLVNGAIFSAYEISLRFIFNGA